jgi:hypothetical protein
MASVGGFVLLAAFAAGAAYADDAQLTFPVTAADAARMLPFGGSAGSAASPAASVTSSASNVGAAAAPSVKAAPVTPPSAAEAAPIAAASPAASATSSAGNAGTAAAPSIVETAPVTTPSASEPAPVAESAPPSAGPVIYSSTSPSVPIRADGQEALMRPTFTTPAVPPIDNPGNDAVLVSAPETQEIPQATAAEAPVATVPPYTVPSSNDLSNYMNDDPQLAGSVGSLRDFVVEGEETSPIGFEVRESRRKLKTGENAEGLLILKVEKNSAAAKAGLRPYQRAAHNVLEGLAIGAAMVFPPAIIALPVIDYTEVGESYDMIIGVDGSRVTNFADFEERMRNVQPGELVYFSVVRNGKRIQIPVPVPALSSSASN